MVGGFSVGFEVICCLDVLLFSSLFHISPFFPLLSPRFLLLCLPSKPLSLPSLSFSSLFAPSVSTSFSPPSLSRVHTPLLWFVAAAVAVAVVVAVVVVLSVVEVVVVVEVSLL